MRVPEMWGEEIVAIELIPLTVGDAGSSNSITSANSPHLGLINRVAQGALKALQALTRTQPVTHPGEL